MTSSSGPDHSAQGPLDDVLRWPAGLSPGFSDLSAHSEVLVRAAPSTVFSLLIGAANWERVFSCVRPIQAPGASCGVVGPGTEFAFEFAGLRLSARVTEFVASYRLAWAAQGIDITMYQSWVISGGPGRFRVQAAVAARGAAAISLREAGPGATQAALDTWVAELKTAAGKATG